MAMPASIDPDLQEEEEEEEAEEAEEEEWRNEWMNRNEYRLTVTIRSRLKSDRDRKSCNVNNQKTAILFKQHT
jgi:hypothetical protein